MKIAFAPEFILNVPENHRFPMDKYDLVPEQLVYEGTIERSDFFRPNPGAREIVQLVHEETYLVGLDELSIPRKEHIKIGLPFTKELIDREYLIIGGILKACHFALEDKVAFTIAGGTHHAFPERGEGFCVFNDVAIASKYLLINGIVKSILIIDLDVHQGNGTAKCLEDEENAFTFSMHGEKNYPLIKEVSDRDVELPIGIQDSEYLSRLEKELKWLESNVAFDFIFYNAGVDILETDKLGKMAVTLEGCKYRDEMVMEFALKHNTPIVTVMGGGYSPDIKTIVEAHCNTYRVAKDLFSLI